MKRLFVVLLVLFLTAGFAACGGGGGNDTSGDTTGNTNPAQACGDITLPNKSPNTTATAGTWTVIQNDYVIPSWVTVVLGANWKIQVTDDLGRIYYGTYSYDGSRTTYNFVTCYWQGYCGSAVALFDTLSVTFNNGAMLWGGSNGSWIIFQQAGKGAMRVKNFTTYPIGYVYIRPVGTSSWSSNMITSPISPFDSALLPNIATGSYNFKAITDSWSIIWGGDNYVINIVADQVINVNLTTN